MPDGVSVTIGGLAEASAALRRLPLEFREVAADTIEVGAAIIEGEADFRVPDDPATYAGDTKRSLGTNIRDDRLQADVGYGNVVARFLEFGTNDTAAQPSLFPAFQIGARYVRKQIRTWAREAAGALRTKGRARVSKATSFKRRRA